MATSFTRRQETRARDTHITREQQRQERNQAFFNEGRTRSAAQLPICSPEQITQQIAAEVVVAELDNRMPYPNWIGTDTATQEMRTIERGSRASMSHMLDTALYMTDTQTLSSHSDTIEALRYLRDPSLDYGTRTGRIQNTSYRMTNTDSPRQRWYAQLLRDIVITYNPDRGTYTGRLYDRRYRVEHSTRHDTEIREEIIHHLINEAMENEMPERFETEPYPEAMQRVDAFLPFTAPAPAPPPPRVPTPHEATGLVENVFTIQQNTQASEIRQLQTNYPRIIFDYNLQSSTFTALNNERNMFRQYMAEYKRYKAYKWIHTNVPRHYADHIQHLLGQQLPSRVYRQIVTGEIEQSTGYSQALEQLSIYRERKHNFIEARRDYIHLQAEYNQRAAMIRQKPNRPKEVDITKTLTDVSTWDNVWGVATKYALDGSVHIRVGLHGIVMEESASETAYDVATPITLAPFLFTILLQTDGRFQCRSGNNNVMGLSYSNDPGNISYDIHPHQLSDTPCFGTFGQSFNDMAMNGEITTLIGGIISFYSQYNSQDSAGVNARNFHPSILPLMSNIRDYENALYRRVDWTTKIIDREKLHTAIENYRVYHAATCAENAPRRDTRPRCDDCEDTCVGDEDDYRVDTNARRICLGCWDDHYCNECEHHVENCECSEHE